MITDRHLMTPVVLVLDGKPIRMWFEPRLLKEFSAWRADRQIFNRSEALRAAIRWAAAHDDTGRQKPVQPSDPVMVQLRAFMAARTLIALTEGVKLCVFRVVSQPWPVGNGRPQRSGIRSGQPELRPARPRLVVDNE